MAKTQYVDIENLTLFKDLLDQNVQQEISLAVTPSIKTVSQNADKSILYFYTQVSPTAEDIAAFSITLPEPVDLTGKADKVLNAITGHFAGIDVNGNLTDSGKKASDFELSGTAAAAKTEVMNYLGTIPSSAVSKNVVAYVKELADAAKYDETSLKALANANKNAIDVLKGTAAGSVAKSISDSLTPVKQDITTNTTRIQNLQSVVGDGFEAIPESSIRNLFNN